MLYIAHMGASTVDGPGRRLVIHFQGCSIRCPGCANKHLWPFNHGNAFSSSDILHAGRDSDGVTLSGGEPFDQPSAINLLRALRKFSPLSVIVFTGYTYKGLMFKLADNWEVVRKSVDLLVCGPYVKSLSSDSKDLRGSTNQQFVALSSLGVTWMEQSEQLLGRQVNIQINEKGDAEMRGIPTPGIEGIIR